MKRRRARHPSQQLGLGLDVRSIRLRQGDAPTALVAEAAARLSEVGYEVADAGGARCRLTVEARLRDWTLTIEARDGAVVARAYVMRAPEDDAARGRVLEAILSINARSANTRFALDRSSVVVDATLAPSGAPIRADALRVAVSDLARTCNDAYPDLVAIAQDDQEQLVPPSLRVA